MLRKESEGVPPLGWSGSGKGEAVSSLLGNPPQEGHWMKSDAFSYAL